MKTFIKKIGIGYFLMIIIVLTIIIVAEYVFLFVSNMHGIFIGLWAPVVIGFMIFFKQLENGSR
jgi:hypothetical protein